MTNKTKLHVGRPNIGNRERFLQRVNEILDRRWLSNNGPVVQEVDKKVTDSVLRSLFSRWAILEIVWRLEYPYVKTNSIW